MAGTLRQLGPRSSSNSKSNLSKVSRRPQNGGRAITPGDVCWTHGHSLFAARAHTNSADACWRRLRAAFPRSNEGALANRDTSLEGAIRGARPDEQERLARLSDQLRQLLRDSRRFSLIDITPIAREAQASNLQAGGGCDTHLAQRIGAELVIPGTVQEVSNRIHNR